MPARKGTRRKARRVSSHKPYRSARARSSRAAEKLPKSAVTLVVIMRPREGQDILLQAELRAMLAPTRKEEGCLRYDLHRSAEGVPGYLLHEIWASREHHAAHTRTDHFLRWNARKDALLASRDVTFWQFLA
jgi:quinol monooxygenase YgiN